MAVRILRPGVLGMAINTIYAKGYTPSWISGQESILKSTGNADDFVEKASDYTKYQQYLYGQQAIANGEASALAGLGVGLLPSKIRAALAQARNYNRVDGAVAATQPTITTAYDASLSTFSVLSPATIGDQFAFYGGSPVSLNGGYAASVGNAGSYGQGLVEFVHDAPRLQIRTNQGTHIVTVDGAPLSKAGNATAAGGGEQQLVLDWGGVVRPRTYGIYLSGGSAFVRVGAGSLYRCYAPKPAGILRFVWEGDSYTAQTGATITAGGYAMLAGALLGVKDNWLTAIGGTGWLNPGSATTVRGRIANVIAANPDVIVVGAGTNDGSATGIQAEVQTYLTQLRAALPNTPVIVLGVWPKTTGPSATIIAIENAVAAAVTAQADALIKFVPISTAALPWLFGTGYVGVTNGSGNTDIYIGPDGQTPPQHPNDAGHDMIARRVVNAVQVGLMSMGVLAP